MKKIITLLILCLVTLSFAGSGASSFTGGTNWGIAKNVTVYTLDSVANGKIIVGFDTVGATYSNYYGPFGLSGDYTRPSFSKLRVLCPVGTLGATCTLSIAYQVLAGDKWSDTLKTGWTVIDSVKAAVGSAGTVVDLSSVFGGSIAFRLYGISGTSIMTKHPKVFMLSTSTETVDTKH